MRDDIGPNSDDPWPDVTRNTDPKAPSTGATEGRVGCLVAGLLVLIPAILVASIWQNGPRPPTIRTLPWAIGMFLALALATVAVVSGVAWLLIRIDRLWDRHAPPGVKAAARAVDRIGRLMPDEGSLPMLAFVLVSSVAGLIGGLFRRDRGRDDDMPGDHLE